MSIRRGPTAAVMAAVLCLAGVPAAAAPASAAPVSASDAVVRSAVSAGATATSDEASATTDEASATTDDAGGGHRSSRQSHGHRHRAASPYLVVGDSIGAGLQPDRGDDRAGGYPAVVAAALAERGHPVRVENVACSGETTDTMIAGGRCDYAAGSQLRQAERFLRHRRDTRLVTVSIGANDVGRCVQGTALDEACLTRGLRELRGSLRVVLHRLRRAAPRAQIVVLDYHNPYLASSLLGPEGRAVAAASTPVLASLNAEIARAARSVGARTAKVSAGFFSTDETPVHVARLGTLPRNVATICAWTWMCERRDVHPNDTGYQVIGQIVLARLEHRRRG